MLEKAYLKFLYQYLGFFLFLIMLLIGLMTYDSYGMGWDEPMQRSTGSLNYEYVFFDDDRLLAWKDKDYGVAFELPLIMLERKFKLTEIQDIYLMRHLVTHLFFLLSGYFLFLLIDYLYKNKLLATIGFFLLMLHPRIYAHSFFNTKDIPFLSMFIICFYFFVKAFDKKTIFSFIKLGICTGLLINMRIMGILVLLVALLILFLDLIRKQERQLTLKLIIILLISSCFSLYITWPYLWNDPLTNFVQVFINMSKFRWNGGVLFNGELIKATELSWKYIPTWFAISTPIIYLLLGIAGSLLLIVQFFRTPYSFLDNSIKRTNLLFLGYFLAPLVAVIVFHSVVYDGWRQMFFIYPPFILIIIYGFSYLLKKKKVFITTMSLMAITFIITASNMIQNFPLQGVYFNEIFLFTSPEYLRKNYEMDYWGVSYKESLEYILKNDSSTSIDLAVQNHPGKANIMMLPPEDRIRFNIVPKDSASYFITNYRFHPHDYNEYADFKFHSFKVGNNTVNEIFKLK